MLSKYYNRVLRINFYESYSVLMIEYSNNLLINREALGYE